MKKNLKEAHQFPLPKNCRQGRSGGTKPRKEFTTSLWSSGSALEILLHKERMQTVGSACSDGRTCYEATRSKKQMQKFVPVRGILEDGCNVPSENVSDHYLPELRSVSLEKLLGITENESGKNSNDGDFDANLSSETFESATDKLDHVITIDNYVQILDNNQIPESPSVPVSGSDLVQPCINSEQASVDLDKAWQRFNDALRGKGSEVSLFECGETSDILGTPMQLHESSNVASGDASCSSKSEDDESERGRGKRKRKAKIHFDEATTPDKPVKSLRRLRIMRYLGLVAPPGSPFSATSHVRTACNSRRVLRV